MTNTADVLTAVVRQENVRPSIDLLSPSLQSAALFRERFEFNVIANHDEKVNILWVSSVGTNRPEQTHLTDSNNANGRANKIQSRREKLLATTWFCVSSHASVSVKR